MAEQGASWPEVQVDAGGDMRRHHSLVVDDVREQQIVHVAAVAGDVDDLMPLASQTADLFATPHRDAAVQLVPQPAEEVVEEANQAIGEVGAYLIEVAQSPGAHSLFAAPLGSGLLADGLHYVVAPQ